MIQVKVDLVVNQDQELVAEELSDLFFACTVILAVTLNKLHCHEARSSRVVVPSEIHLFGVNALELLLVSVYFSLTILSEGKERCLTSVLCGAQLIRCARMRRDLIVVNIESPIFSLTPSVLFKDELAILFVENGLCVAIVGRESDSKV